MAAAVKHGARVQVALQAVAEAVHDTAAARSSPPRASHARSRRPSETTVVSSHGGRGATVGCRIVPSRICDAARGRPTKRAVP